MPQYEPIMHCAHLITLNQVVQVWSAGCVYASLCSVHFQSTASPTIIIAAALRSVVGFCQLAYGTLAQPFDTTSCSTLPRAADIVFSATSTRGTRVATMPASLGQTVASTLSPTTRCISRARLIKRRSNRLLDQHDKQPAVQKDTHHTCTFRGTGAGAVNKVQVKGVHSPQRTSTCHLYRGQQRAAANPAPSRSAERTTCRSHGVSASGRAPGGDQT